MAETILRVAVATTDGTRVDQHLGRVERFFIFETSAAGATLLAQRCPEPDAGRPGHDPGRMAEILRQIEDCSVVVALRVGPAFLRELEARGIRVLTSDWSTGPLLDRIGRSYLARCQKSYP